MTAPCSRRMRPAEGKPGTDAPTTHALERTPRGTRRVLGHERSTRTSPRARSATSEKARHESPCDHDDDRPLDVAPGVGSSGPTLPREQVPVGSAALESQRGNPSGAVPATKVARSGTNGSTHLAGSPAGSLAGSPARRAQARVDTDGPGHHGDSGRASARTRRAEKALWRLDRWESDDLFIAESGLQWAKPKEASGACQVEIPGERNGFVSGRKP
jgi:hypothetical protein